jgi:hypothetical protein
VRAANARVDGFHPAFAQRLLAAMHRAVTGVSGQRIGYRGFGAFVPTPENLSPVSRGTAERTRSSTPPACRTGVYALCPVRKQLILRL